MGGIRGLGSIGGTIASVVFVIGCGQSRPSTDPFDASALPGDGASDDDPMGETTDPATGDGSTPDGDADADAEESGDDPIDDGSYPHVARLQKPADWIVHANGSWTVPQPANPNDVPYFAVSHEFYADHADDYDFLVIYFEGVISEDFWATMIQVDDSVTGIGQDAWGNWTDPSEAGSAGRLQQLNVMNAASQYMWDPSDADVIVHETVHRWSAWIELPGAPEGILRDASRSHWNIHAHTGGPSVTGYGDLTDLGGGRYRWDEVRPWKVSPLELYLAGLMPAHEVPPMFYVRDGYDYDPPLSWTGAPFTQDAYGEPATFSGTRVEFTIDDVIAANGPRLPAYGEARSDFRFAFALVCADVDACNASDLAIVEAQRTAFPTTLATATNGRASATTEL